MTSARAHCCTRGAPPNSTAQCSTTCEFQTQWHMRISNTMALLHNGARTCDNRCMCVCCTRTCDNRCMCVCCNVMVRFYSLWVSCITLSYACARNSTMRLIVRSDGGHAHILSCAFGPPPWPPGSRSCPLLFLSTLCTHGRAVLCGCPLVRSLVLHVHAYSRAQHVSAIFNVQRYDLRTCALL